MATTATTTMSSDTAAPRSPTSTKARWVGRILSALPVVVLTMSASMKLSHAPAFVTTWQRLGFDARALTPIGVLEVLCTVLYLVPRTAILGAVLLTGYLGGAVVTHLRVGEPFVIPLVLGFFVWGGLHLREPRLRALLPLR